jgi:excisionase family DNA binding protein
MLSKNLSSKEMPPPSLLTGDEVAAILKVSRSFAYSMMRNGEIPVVRLGRSVRVEKNSLLTFIQDKTTTGFIQ